MKASGADMQRRTLIGYDHGLPQVKELQPPQETEREPVPSELQLHTMDTLSALAQLMRRVEHDHACETEVHTYDGRRVLDIVARTGGPERLDPTGRSTFSGPTLRCDFEGREVAGFLFGQDDPEHRRPLHGSAWLAPVLPNAPPLPVRIAVSDPLVRLATMYLTSAVPGEALLNSGRAQQALIAADRRWRGRVRTEGYASSRLAIVTISAKSRATATEPSAIDGGP